MYVKNAILSKKKFNLASFQQHLNISVIASGVLIVPLHSAGILNINEAIIALILGLVGGMLPDLDLDYSKPSQIFFQMLSIFSPLILLMYFAKEIPLVYNILIWFLMSFFLHFVLRKTLGQFTTHRGIFHSIPMGVVFAQIALFISQELLHQSSSFSSILAFFIFFGFMTHLILDEVFSIDIHGMRMKKSFGTAVKLYDKNNIIGTLILYILMLVMLKFIPINTEIYIHVFNVLSGIKLF